MLGCGDGSLMERDVGVLEEAPLLQLGIQPKIASYHQKRAPKSEIGLK